ncbi:CvpA family protein [Sphingomonas sp. JC676]|uniref:CvpA family protein n=1 Tax=Sphingomonas sp. JC676 TaxID=2768065 RepID=UPI0016580BCE|nr:CvpA family protein [Sphingomonas sp. JC676]MBC9031044.1 CvpA family protein [Sphingomonas sp. JC676]
MTGLDIIVLIVIGGAAILGFLRGFVTEVLALLAWILVVVALKFFHTPVAQFLSGIVGTTQGGAVLAFAMLGGVTYFAGRLLANDLGSRMRDSFLGPIDRALGLGFGALKGLILASIAFLLLVLVFDTVGGGPSQRPDWITKSVTYPMLDATSAGIADFVDRRRKGEPVFGGEKPADDTGNKSSHANSMQGT